jgi:hypothetical protein
VTVEQAIYTRIAGLPAVQAIVATRVYLDKTPQDPTYPLVLIYSAGDHRYSQLRGPEGLGQARITVEARAHEESGEDAYQVTTLYDAFDGDGRGPTATGIFGWTGTVDTVRIAHCAHRGSRDRFYDPDVHRVLRMAQDYWVTYRLAAA